MSFVFWVFYGICWLLLLLFWMKSMLTFCHFLALHAFEQFHHRYFALSSGTPQKWDSGNIPKKKQLVCQLYANCIPKYTSPIPSLYHPFSIPIPSLYHPYTNPYTTLYHPIPPYTNPYTTLYHPIPSLYHPSTIAIPIPLPPYTTLYHPIPIPIPPYTTLYHPIPSLYQSQYHPISPYTTLYNPYTIPIPSPYQLYISLYQYICRFHICAVFRWTKQQLRKKRLEPLRRNTKKKCGSSYFLSGRTPQNASKMRGAFSKHH